MILPMLSLSMLRDKARHDQLRRIWDRAFGSKGSVSLRGFISVNAADMRTSSTSRL